MFCVIANRDTNATEHSMNDLMLRDACANELFLLPEHQCKGIGRACMALIIEEAHRQALPVRLRVMKANPRALAFYQTLGFVQTGETHTHALLEYGLP